MLMRYKVAKRCNATREDLVLPTVRAPFSQSCLSTSRLAENTRACSTKDDSLCVREDSRDGKATRALHIHKVRVRGLHKSLELVAPLFGLSRGVEEVDGESHFGCRRMLEGPCSIWRERATFCATLRGRPWMKLRNKVFTV